MKSKEQRKRSHSEIAAIISNKQFAAEIEFPSIDSEDSEFDFPAEPPHDEDCQCENCCASWLF